MNDSSKQLRHVADWLESHGCGGQGVTVGAGYAGPRCLTTLTPEFKRALGGQQARRVARGYYDYTLTVDGIEFQLTDLNGPRPEPSPPDVVTVNI